MLMKTGLAAALLLAMAVPAVAETCVEPVAPVMSVDGTTATKDQMEGAIKDFKTFQSGADDYADCVTAEIHKMQDAAKNSKDQKPVDPSIVSGMNAKVSDVQAEKEKLGGQLNVQIKLYLQMHPSKPKAAQ